MPLIEIGRKAPSFELRDQHGHPHGLADYSRRPLVLYFYPKDDTPDCTSQACQFRDLHPDFAHIKAAVLGISPDDEPSHRVFDEKHALRFPLLVDLRGKDGAPTVCKAYGAWEKKTMFGRPYMGVTRTTYLIDGDGRVVKRWDRVRVAGHGREVLRAVKDLIGVAVAGGKQVGPAGRRSRSHDSNPPYTPIRGGRGPSDLRRIGRGGGTKARTVKQRGRMK